VPGDVPVRNLGEPGSASPKFQTCMIVCSWDAPLHNGFHVDLHNVNVSILQNGHVVDNGSWQLPKFGGVRLPSY
jgi:hypothetical protein